MTGMILVLIVLYTHALLMEVIIVSAMLVTCESTAPVHSVILLQSLTCSGNCPCSPGLMNLNGVITNGHLLVPWNTDCVWLITNKAVIYFKFTEVHTEYETDWVNIDKCETAACNAPIQLWRNFYGYENAKTLTAAGVFQSDPVLYPFLQIQLHTTYPQR